MSRIELEESSGVFPTADLRPRMDEPPPVRLIAVDDVRMLTLPGLATDLDLFYVGLLEFSRDPATEDIVYRGENFRLRFAVIDQMPLERDAVRPIGIEVRSLRDTEKKLFDNQINYERQRSLYLGIGSLLLKDPAGNWIEVFQTTTVR